MTHLQWFEASNESTERVIEVDLGVVPTPGAPMPSLLQGPHRTFLVFYLAAIDPSGRTIGIFEWLVVHATMFGTTNEEGIPGHLLWNRGLADVDFAGEVLNSRWITALDEIDRHHPNYWHRMADARHIIIPFQDETFECVVNGFRVESTDDSMDDVLARLVREI